jgi:ATP-dependent DNA ligase
MLANPSSSLEPVEHFVTNTEGSGRPIVAKWKYDGMRCQARWDGQTTKLFSWHLLDTTDQRGDDFNKAPHGFLLCILIRVVCFGDAVIVLLPR